MLSDKLRQKRDALARTMGGDGDDEWTRRMLKDGFYEGFNTGAVAGAKEREETIFELLRKYRDIPLTDRPYADLWLEAELSYFDDGGKK